MQASEGRHKASNQSRPEVNSRKCSWLLRAVPLGVDCVLHAQASINHFEWTALAPKFPLDQSTIVTGSVSNQVSAPVQKVLCGNHIQTYRCLAPIH